MESRFMDNPKDDNYYLGKIIKDLEFIIDHTNFITMNALISNEVLLDSIMFRIIQIAENNSKISDDFKSKHPEVPWIKIKAMRNIIVHDYGNVNLKTVFDTVKISIPKYLKILKLIKSSTVNITSQQN